MTLSNWDMVGGLPVGKWAGDSSSRCRERVGRGYRRDVNGGSGGAGECPLAERDDGVVPPARSETKARDFTPLPPFASPR
ncbi:hypothetical protein JCM17961_36800 [Endothiovibrio diazotrophicus]